MKFRVLASFWYFYSVYGYFFLLHTKLYKYTHTRACAQLTFELWGGRGGVLQALTSLQPSPMYLKIWIQFLTPPTLVVPWYLWGMGSRIPHGYQNSKMLNSSWENGIDQCIQSALCIHRLPTVDWKRVQVFIEKKNLHVSWPVQFKTCVLCCSSVKTVEKSKGQNQETGLLKPLSWKSKQWSQKQRPGQKTIPYNKANVWGKGREGGEGGHMTATGKLRTQGSSMGTSSRPEEILRSSTPAELLQILSLWRCIHLFYSHGCNYYHGWTSCLGPWGEWACRWRLQDLWARDEASLGNKVELTPWEELQDFESRVLVLWSPNTL